MAIQKERKRSKNVSEKKMATIHARPFLSSKYREVYLEQRRFDSSIDQACPQIFYTPGQTPCALTGGSPHTNRRMRHGGDNMRQNFGINHLLSAIFFDL